MKKILSLLMIGASAVGLGSCDSKPKSSSPAGNLEIEEKQAETLAYQVTTSLASLGDLNSASGLIRARSIEDAAKAEIVNLLPTVDRLLSNKAGFSSALETSDREGYETKQTVSFVDISAAEVSFDLYYNVDAREREEDRRVNRSNSGSSAITPTLPPDSELIPPSTDQNPSTPTLPSGDSEEEIKISGIAVIKGESFNFTGETSLEIEADEREEEMSLKIEVSDSSCVKVEQEISFEAGEREEEYSYEIIEDGVKTFGFSLEKEDELGELETEIKLTLDGVKYHFSPRQEDEVDYIDVTVAGDDGGKISFKKVILVDDETGETSVSYEEIV